MIVQVLSGHTSPDTAYLVTDYPYGFRLRCKIRYWLEYKPGRGYRLVSQTTNPKRPGEVWNKPKKSTYSRFGEVMYLDEHEHVQSIGLSEYDNLGPCEAFLAAYGHTLPEHGLKTLQAYVKVKQAYELKKAEEVDYRVAARIAIASEGGFMLAQEQKGFRG